MPAWCSDPKADFACKEQSQSRFESSRSLFAFSLCILFCPFFFGGFAFFYHILLFLLVSFILTADPLQLREIFSLFQAFR